MAAFLPTRLADRALLPHSFAPSGEEIFRLLMADELSLAEVVPLLVHLLKSLVVRRAVDVQVVALLRCVVVWLRNDSHRTCGSLLVHGQVSLVAGSLLVDIAGTLLV